MAIGEASLSRYPSPIKVGSSWFHSFFHWCCYLSLAGAFLLTLLPFSKSYFYFDDFNCFFRVQQLSFGGLIRENLDITSQYFRPFYMLMYWIFWKLFGLHALPYHVFAWVIHGVNIGLVYKLINKAVRNALASAVGALLFSYHVAFLEIYYNFACVGEPLCAMFFFLGIWVFMTRGKSLSGIFLCNGLFILAFKSKEMAITLPCIWLLYETVVENGRGPNEESIPLFSRLKSLGVRFLLPGVLSLIFLGVKLPDMGGLVNEHAPYGPAHPYYMNFSPSILLQSYSWYFEVLVAKSTNIQGFAIGIWVPCLLILYFTKNRWTRFFVLYIFITLFPVIILANHRFAYYWYLPFLGIAGLVAQGFNRVVTAIEGRVGQDWGEVIAFSLFLLTTTTYYAKQASLSESPRAWVHSLTEENRRFVLGLTALPQPHANETIYFSAVPRFFDNISIRSTTQVVFRRIDLGSKIVEEFPREARYRVHFSNDHFDVLAWDNKNLLLEATPGRTTLPFTREAINLK